MDHGPDRVEYGPDYDPAYPPGPPLVLVEPRRPGTRVTASDYDALVRYVNEALGPEIAAARAQVCPRPSDAREGVE
jgi:hypothetical protein